MALPPVSRRLVWFGGVLLLLLMVLAVTLTMLNMRAFALQQTRGYVAKLAIAVAEQTTRAIQAVDLAVQDQRAAIGQDALATPAGFAAALQTQAVNTELRQRIGLLPQLDALGIVGAAGKVINFSRRWPVPLIDVSDRDYFRYLSTHDDPAPFISQPVISRGSGGWTVFVARRVDGPGDVFLGVIVGSIQLDYLCNFYRQLIGGAPDTSVSLLRTDGAMVARYPAPALPAGQSSPVTPPAPDQTWLTVAANGRARTLTTPERVTGAPLIAAIDPLAAYKLLVAITVPQATALESWRQASAVVALGTLCAVFAMLVLLRALGIQLQRLETSQAALAERNRDLERTYAQLETQAGELHASRETLAQKSAVLASTLEHIDQGILMIDADRRVAVCNARCLQMLGLPDSLMNTPMSYDELSAHQLANGDPLNGVPPLLARGLLPDRRVVYERQRPDGHVLEVVSVPLPGGGMVRTFTDITDRRAADQRVRFVADHDDLTKLANRAVFRERLDLALKLADRSGRSVAVFYLDLDRFKLVNDTRGHAVGDCLLAQVAERLRGAVRRLDTIARVGGDEFAIIQPLVERQEHASPLAERLLELLRHPFELEGGQCSIGVSIGIAYYPEQADTAEDLLRRADMALYHAKSEGRGVQRVFRPAMEARQRELYDLEQDLAQALNRNQFTLNYQPIVCAADARITGLAALLGWSHPERGLIPRAAFAELAERSGLIEPIGAWMLQAACEMAATLPPGISLAIEISPLQLTRPGFAQSFRDLLARTGAQPEQLLLQISALPSAAETATNVETLQQTGLRFGLGDAGLPAGLLHLRRCRFHALQIGSAFTADLPHLPAARAIVAAIVGVGTSLGMDIIVQGSQSDPQWPELRRMGVTHLRLDHALSAAAARRLVAQA